MLLAHVRRRRVEVRMNVFMITILMIQLTHESDSKSIVSDDEQGEINT